MSCVLKFSLYISTLKYIKFSIKIIFLNAWIFFRKYQNPHLKGEWGTPIWNFKKVIKKMFHYLIAYNVVNIAQM